MIVLLMCMWIVFKFDFVVLVSGLLMLYVNLTMRSIYDFKFADIDVGVCMILFVLFLCLERMYKVNFNIFVFVFVVEVRCNECKSVGKRVFGLCTSFMVVSVSEERERVDLWWLVKYLNMFKYKFGMICFKFFEVMYISVVIDLSVGLRMRVLELEM